MPTQKHIIEISFATMLKAALLAIALWALWELRGIVMVLTLSIIVASAIEPINQWLTRYRIPRVIGVVMVYVALLLVLFGIFYIILPPLFGDILNFLISLPSYVDKAFRPNSAIFDLFPDLPYKMQQSFHTIAVTLERSFESNFSFLTKGTITAGSSVFGGVFSVMMLFVVSFYLSVQERGIENFLRIVSPIEYESYALNLWARAQRKIGRWLQGQMILGVLVGVIVFLMLSILDIKHALVLAFLAAIFEIIPVFGPILAALPAIALASIQSPSLGLLVAGLYVLVQQVESHLIYPLVVRKTIGVPPLLVVLALLIGAELGGIFGILVSVPIAAILVEFLNDLSEHKYPHSHESE
jgi:predicted PurR-regulated permease PerM